MESNPDLLEQLVLMTRTALSSPVTAEHEGSIRGIATGMFEDEALITISLEITEPPIGDVPFEHRDTWIGL